MLLVSHVSDARAPSIASFRLLTCSYKLWQKK